MNSDRTKDPGRKEEYLAKARDAETQAAHASDHDQRERWLLIARSYRNMALWPACRIWHH